MEDETEHQEFPKMLYLGGAVRTEEGRPVPHHHTRTVNDAEEEAAARAEGFAEAAAPEDPEPVEGSEGAQEETAEVVAGEDAEAPDAEAAEGAEAPEAPQA